VEPTKFALIDSAPATVGQLAERYCEMKILGEATRRNYLGVARVFDKDTGMPELGSITADLVATWRKIIVERAGETTWNTYRRELKTLFKWALAKGWAHHNPFYEVEAVWAPRRKKTVQKEIIHRAVELLESEQSPIRPGWFWIIALRMFYFTGIRLKQLATLRWEHLEFGKNTILLTAEGSKTKREWVIPMPSELQEDLLFLRQETLAKSPLLGQQVFRIQLFNARFAGTEMSPEQAGRAFKKLSQVLGERITPHRLRHTMATELAQGEYPDLKSLQYLLGHTDVRMTMEYINPEMRQIQSLLSRLNLKRPT
jgi:integrase